MQLNELEKAWGRFNEKINSQVLVDKQQIEEMLTKRRRDSYKKLVHYEQFSLCIIIVSFLFTLVAVEYTSIYWTMLSSAFAIAVLIAFCVNMFQYCKLMQAGIHADNLEEQILHMLQYQMSIYWGYIIIYIAFTPGIVIFLLYADIFYACVVVGLILLLTLLDIFIFKKVSGKIGGLIEISQELKRIKDIQLDSSNAE